MTLPTTRPSGVMTPMLGRMPVALAAVKINGLAGGICAPADHSGAHHRYIHVRLAELQQRGKTVGFVGFVLELRDLEL